MSSPLVLCYHAVSHSWPAPLAVDPDALDQQLGLLARCGYRGVSFSELALAPNPGKVVALTFDDSYASVRELAAPILERHGFSGTVFVPTEFVDSSAPMAWPGVDQWLGTEHESELISMGWAELRDLADRGWEVGSHTVTHPRLTELDEEDLSRELIESKRAIEAGIGRECRSLAYPYGRHDRRVIDATAAAGYRAAGTLWTGVAPGSPLRWPRIGVYRGDDRSRFILKALSPFRRLRSSSVGRGASRWARRAQRRDPPPKSSS